MEEHKAKFVDGRLLITCPNPAEWRVPDGVEIIAAQNTKRLKNFERKLERFKTSWSEVEIDNGKDYMACLPNEDLEPMLDTDVMFTRGRTIVLPHHPQRANRSLSHRKFQDAYFKSSLSHSSTEIEFSEIESLFVALHGDYIIDSKQLNGFKRFWIKYSARYSTTIQYISQLVSAMDETLPELMPLLHPPIRSVTLSLRQCSTLLAAAFFGFFRTQKRDDCQYFDFEVILAKTTPLMEQKLLFIFNYFLECEQSEANNRVDRNHCITLYRRRLKDELIKWRKSDTMLWKSKMCLSRKTPIEGFYNAAHLDFANKYIGGGVLTEGAVQEEIRLLCCPDALVALLFSPVMNDREAIHIIGAPTVSGYKGYSETLKFELLSNKDDRIYRDVDKFNRCNTEIIAIDALNFFRKSPTYQWSEQAIERELNKAYAGFYNENPTEKGRPLATGKWGCGAFGGDPFLKALIQWMAAAECNRDLVFVVLDDEQLYYELDAFVTCFKKFNMTVGALFNLLLTYKWRNPQSPEHITLQQYLIDTMSEAYDGDLLQG